MHRMKSVKIIWYYTWFFGYGRTEIGNAVPSSTCQSFTPLTCLLTPVLWAVR